ncbi:30S ribosome-binding factor RbfA [Nafulsella turpanensis]|uniref:30S ribosome-binding factor RbfA n=1 Tax=Nafulsella turpanensis TaxID=1265690 RepID=UPI0003781905|nr:30S ribosome-binding factor RbfA [Nafulsella turpanensis]
MSESKRQQKFARLLQKELSEVFQRDIKHLLKNTFVTVTSIRMSPDLSVAKVDLSFMLAPNPQQILETLNEHKSEVRGALGRRIGKDVRHIPELIFYLNEGADYASRMDRIINDLNIPPADEEE